MNTKSFTPFYDKAAELSKLNTRFFVPGHKGNAAALSPFASVLPFDLTEIDGADDLSHPHASLLESQENMAKAFGSAATLYSAFGTTSCIEAMLHLHLRPGEPVIMARGCHIAALRALIFTGAFPVWLPVQNGLLSLPHLEQALQKHPKAPVYVTSFDYFGRCINLEPLAKMCRHANVPLLVDNAHGAHLAFLSPSLHPLHLGATAVADSAHKTLPCLTGAALLHLQSDKHKGKAREILNLYSSTSPSYLVLESLDLCAAALLSGTLDFESAAKNLALVARDVPHLCEPMDDPFKLCLHPALGGWTASEVRESLAEKGLLPEYCDGKRLVFMASACNSKEDFQALSAALCAFPPRAPIPTQETPPLPPPEIVCSPREAFFAKKKRLPVSQAIHRVAASLDAPCPPGVPLVAPGERIQPQIAQALAKGGILEIDVVE